MRAILRKLPNKRFVVFNPILKTGQFKITEICFMRVLEARSLKLNCHQARVPQNFWWRSPFSALMAPGIPGNYGCLTHISGFPGGASVKEPTCQWGRHERHGFDPWVRKVSWRRAWQPTPVYLPGESSWTEDPGELQSIRSQRVGHDWSNLVGKWMYKASLRPAHFRVNQYRGRCGPT